jgi:3-dehydroquinate synthase
MGAGLLAHAGELLAPVLGASKVGIITNATVGEFYLDPLEKTLMAHGINVAKVLVHDGEQHKNLSSLATIYDQLIDQKFERNSMLIALGGGVVGDLAGFAAATFLRGIPYIQIPTTLLAQVDSSVGGKTGVNHRAGKNLIGAFYQPRAVLIDVEVLHSLPRREFLAGMAEVIKYGIIADSHLFRRLEESIERLIALDQDLLIEIIASSCGDKATVVEKDEREEDYRAVLNFGHTVGHALEALTGYEQFLHGEAVAVGMVQAAKISRLLGFCDGPSFRRIGELIARTGLPAELPSGLDLTALAENIEIDKKSSGGNVKFVCCMGIGATCFHWLSPQEIVRALSSL